MQRVIVYGDIHGCYDALLRLREKVDPQEDDIEVCVGDIITKGQDSLKTLRYIQKKGIKSVLGNHEDKLVRYLEHEKSLKKNPITLDEDEQKIVTNLSPKDRDFLKKLPLFLKFKNLTILHGGLQNHHELKSISKREQAKILRLRYLDENLHFVMHGEEDENSTFWVELYDGHEGFIIYGHQHFDEPRINRHAIGIDTGCVYGNKLSAVMFKSRGDSYDVENYTIESSHLER